MSEPLVADPLDASRRDPRDGSPAKPSTRARRDGTQEAHIGRGDRVVIFGKTGTGKSVMLRHLMRAYSRAVLADPKGRAHMDGWPVVYGVAAFRSTWPAKVARVVARPAAGEDRAAWLDELCRIVYHTGETALGIDEVIGMATASKPLRWLDAVLTQGRELGITTIVCSQRPRRIPTTIVSEADHVIAFYLNRRDDREEVADVIGDYANPPPGTYRYAYWTGALDTAVECAPLDRAA